MKTAEADTEEEDEIKTGDIIAGKNNPTIKRIRALRQRKERERTRRFFVEGTHLVTAALRSNALIETLVVVPELITTTTAREAVRTYRAGGGAFLTVTPAVLETLAEKHWRQGIGAVVRLRWNTLEQATPSQRELCWLALDAIGYPSNLGTILRTSDAVRGAGVLLLGHTTDPYDPAAVRASMGAVFSQHLVRATPEAFAAWKARHNAIVIGTSPYAAADYRDAAAHLDHRRPIVLLLGSERAGVSESLKALCDILIRIPMEGHCDSLNVAVSAGIVLYEMRARADSRR